MRYLSFCERDVVNVGLDGQLSEPEADGIERLATFMPRGSITREHRALRFGPFCGVLQTPNVTIELLPKIDRGFESTADMRGLLVAMLAVAGELRFTKVNEADLGRQTTHLLDVFIHDFCERLRMALRRGAITLYTDRSENLNSVRGRIQLTDHICRNAFNHSRLFCRYDERAIDNPFNRVLKAVLRLLLGHSLNARTKANVASLLHRLNEVKDNSAGINDLDELKFDRTIDHWRDVFHRARWFLAGLFPDVRRGDTSGSALLFNMERLFEEVLGRRIQGECRKFVGRKLRVQLQKQQLRLSTEGFLLRPDITVQADDQVVAILDAKWKRLMPQEPNSAVSSADAYQMNAYADRYLCGRLALVYPASRLLGPGLIREFHFRTPGQPTLYVIAVDIHDLAFGRTMPVGLEEVIPLERIRKQAQATT